MQLYANRHPEALTESVLDALSDLAAQRPRLSWVSPLERDSYREYQDAGFLRAVGLEHLASDLADFWPAGGPVWDGLAVAELASGKRGVVLAEAKSYPEELYGAGSKAGESGSEQAIANRDKIVEALRETQDWLGLGHLNPEAWMGPLSEDRAASSLYQTANRLAHLYWLVEKADQQAWLVHVLVEEDPTFRATSRGDWEAALRAADEHLGLESTAPRVGHAFLPGLDGSEL